MRWKLFPLKKDIDVKGLYTLHYAEYDRNFYSCREQHDFWEMTYLDQGEMVCVVDGASCRLSQGDLIFYKPMAYHNVAANGKEAMSAFVVSFECRDEALELLADKIFTLDKNQKKMITRILEEGRKVFRCSAERADEPESEKDIGAYQLTVALLEQLLIDLLRRSRENDSDVLVDIRKTDAKEALIETINAYLAQNVCGQLQLEDVCREFNRSKSSLCQLYKSMTGKSLIDHYIDLKINRAKYMILEGNLNYTQISEALGMGSLNYFTRIFKKRTGMSPSAYEKSIRDRALLSRERAEKGI